MPKRKSFKLFVKVILAIILALYAAYHYTLDPYRGTVRQAAPVQALDAKLTKDEAKQDLDYLIRMLKDRHPACLRALAGPVQLQYEQELASLPETTTTLRLWQAAARIAARLGDAHTSVIYQDQKERQLPVTLTMAKGKLIWLDSPDGEREIRKINGTPVKQLYATFLQQCSFELESLAAHRFANCLKEASYLAFVGIDISDGVIALTLLSKDGAGEEQQCLEFGRPLQPAKTDLQPFVSYSIDRQHNLGILTLTECNLDDFYRRTLQNFFSDVKEQGITNVAIDLRENGGGNSDVIREFLQYIPIETYAVCGDSELRLGPFLLKNKKQLQNNVIRDDLRFEGRVFALTSTNTFSSAQMFATAISDNGVGEIIGETPGNMPSSYGDVLVFQMPRTGLFIFVSYKHFGRVDETKQDLPLIPDYEVEADQALTKLYELVI